MAKLNIEQIKEDAIHITTLPLTMTMWKQDGIIKIRIGFRANDRYNQICCVNSVDERILTQMLKERIENKTYGDLTLNEFISQCDASDCEDGYCGNGVLCEYINISSGLKQALKKKMKR